MVPFRQGDAEMDTVRIGIYSQVDSLRFAPIHVAAQRGYFKDVDIEPEYFYAHGPGMQKALASSETDVGPTTVERMLKAYGQEVPFKIVASYETWGPGKGPQHFVALPELVQSGKLKDYADLKGKKIGLEKDRIDPDWLVANRALDRAGLTFDDVEIVWASVGERRDKGLAACGIEVTIIYQPAAIIAGVENGTLAVWKHCGELFPGRQGQLMAFAPQFAGEKNDVARRFMVAYVRGVRDYLDAIEGGKNREGMIDLLNQATGDPRSTIEFMPSLGVPRDVRVDLAAMQKETDLFAENGFLPNGIKIAPIVDDQFAAHASEQLK
jgi:NitT/TauT family transport system substrate-binding protein